MAGGHTGKGVNGRDEREISFFFYPLSVAMLSFIDNIF